MRVWIDEAEIQIGDSLIAKIEAAIDDVDFLGVILSPNSVDSEWVRREVEIAMNQEIRNRKVKVLPLLRKPCDLPGFLLGKLYADFSKPSSYPSAFQKLVRRLTRLTAQTRYGMSSSASVADVTGVQLPAAYAHGTQVVELEVVYTYETYAPEKDREKDGEDLIYPQVVKTLNTTWDDLFLAVAHLMMSDAQEPDLRDALDRTYEDKIRSIMGDEIVENEDERWNSQIGFAWDAVRQVMFQFAALGLCLRVGKSDKYVYDTSVWRLTEEGFRYMIENSAIRSDGRERVDAEPSAPANGATPRR